ncbi:MAG: hypothetical protein GVY36_13795, partial [Verrucomicrobia bacterium]|nr:hypothetical protein [Verrucomicrobiota bacterium]
FVHGIRNYRGPGHSEQNKHNYEFTGNAGGKFYGIVDHANLYNDSTADPNFRKVFIENTSNPITFYGLNLERGGFPRPKTQYPFAEIKNASNIRVLGCKTETYGTVFKIDNTNNILITNVFSHLAHEDPLIDITANSTDFMISQVLVKSDAQP